MLNANDYDKAAAILPESIAAVFYSNKSLIQQIKRVYLTMGILYLYDNS